MEGKVIAITGGASGIGLSLAKLLVSRGAAISIADVSRASLDRVFDAFKEAHLDVEKKVFMFQCDVRNLDQVRDWIKQTLDNFGKLDGAANLAGVIGKSHGSGGIDQTDEDEWDFIIGVNLTVR